MSFPEPFFRWRPHPWHGIEVGPNPPRLVHAYIEITPFDLVKYEIDKVTGYMRVDRPQRSSSQPPTLYGIIPRTYCGKRVGQLSTNAQQGDGDPLDICVVSERPISRSEVIANAVVVGGLEIVDQGEADDKIIAVLENDNVWGKANDVSDLPGIIIERLRHYFSTYKLVPGKESRLQIERVYDHNHALKVVEASMADYQETYGE
ncbi:MAG: inorganic pyrophosphatase [Chloroflexota bacterium]|nr:inorganic pyrophosphatase [Chloroflexota bacterium]